MSQVCTPARVSATAMQFAVIARFFPCFASALPAFRMELNGHDGRSRFKGATSLAHPVCPLTCYTRYPIASCPDICMAVVYAEKAFYPSDCSDAVNCGSFTMLTTYRRGVMHCNYLVSQKMLTRHVPGDDEQVRPHPTMAVQVPLYTSTTDNCFDAGLRLSDRASHTRHLENDVAKLKSLCSRCVLRARISRRHLPSAVSLDDLFNITISSQYTSVGAPKLKTYPVRSTPASPILSLARPACMRTGACIWVGSGVPRWQGTSCDRRGVRERAKMHETAQVTNCLRRRPREIR